MNSHLDTDRLWFSRASFGVAAAALLAMVYAGCQERTQVEPKPEPKTESVQTPAATPKIQTAAMPAPVTQPEAKPPETAPPSKVDAPKPKAPTGLVPDTLAAKRFVVTTEVKDREPVPATIFTPGEITAFVELSNSADVDQKVVITFEQGEKKIGFVELTVPAKQTRWRTWGKTRNLKQTGTWSAVVATEDGTELQRVEFEVSESPLQEG